MAVSVCVCPACDANECHVLLGAPLRDHVITGALIDSMCVVRPMFVIARI